MPKSKFNKGCKGGRMPSTAVYAVLRAIIPERQALILSGMSPKSNVMEISRYNLTVAEIRERLADIPGLVSYLDNIADLVEIKDEAMKSGNHEVALNAIGKIGKMQGYDAPQKIEVDNKIKISGAVLEIKAILDRTGLNAEEVRREISRRRAEKREIEAKEVPFEVINQRPPTKVEVEV